MDDDRNREAPEGEDAPEYEVSLAPADQFEEFREEIARWLEEATGSRMEDQLFVSDKGDLLFLMDLQPTGEFGGHDEDVIAPTRRDWDRARSALLGHGVNIGPYEEMETSDTNLVSLARRTLAARGNKS